MNVKVQGNPRSLETPPKLERRDDYWVGSFSAMASPCEVLVNSDDYQLAQRLTRIAEREARRVEAKFSRYLPGNIIARINGSGGRPVELDSETANLIDYAAQCYALSEGRFDITSGVLREVWQFDGSDKVPTAQAVDAVRQRVGWDKVQWQRPRLTIPVGMEIDLGGIGKEYAVDRTVQLLRQHTELGLVVNFGGDLVVTGPRRGGRTWRVGIEDPRQEGFSEQLSIARGALATSGDARRFLERGGIRYGHILDPRTGWPVQGGPRSVTVCGNTCMEAGMLATFAILQGTDAESFLNRQEIPYRLN